MRETGYDRAAALAYARRWALDRNPDYYNFDAVGGDCTNFVSQCLAAGGAAMNYAYPMGWFYIDAGHRAPAWSGVEFFYNFITGNAGVGPYGRGASPEEVLAGDMAQLSFDARRFSHNLLVIKAGPPGEMRIAAHTLDSYDRLLSSYSYKTIRYIHIEGGRT